MFGKRKTKMKILNFVLFLRVKDMDIGHCLHKNEGKKNVKTFRQKKLRFIRNKVLPHIIYT